ncbi:MAG: TIM barrel protein [Hyphomicrobiales bacterium]|nr:TIM barrel protein [Hyphomicrobiales bacterium]
MQQRVLGVGYSLRSDDDYDFKKLTDALAEAERLRPDFIELPLFSLDVIAGAAVLPARMRLLKSITADRPFRYTVHGPLAVNLMDAPERLPQHMAVLKAALDAAAELGAVHYIHHGGLVEAARAPQMDALYAQQRDALAEVAPIAAAAGLVITVENLFTYDMARTTALPSRLAAEIAAIGHPNIRACLDFSHGFINSTLHGADFGAEAAALSPLAKHLHIHDSFGRLTAAPTYSRAERVAYGYGDLHLPIGLGAIPWRELMTGLSFPDGLVLNLELAPPYWSELPACMAALREMEETLRARNA